MSSAYCDPRDRHDDRTTPKTFDGKRWHHGPIDQERGRLRFMARSGGYVMCRKPRAMPFVLTEKEWAKLPIYQEPAAK